VNTIELVLPSAHPSPQPKWQIDRFIRFAPVTTESLPILHNGPPLPPSKLPRPIGGSGLPSNTWFLGLTKVINPNGILIGSAVFAGLTSVTNRPTNGPRYSVGYHRPHLHVVLRCGLLIVIARMMCMMLSSWLAIVRIHPVHPVSLPVGCYNPHPPSPFIITQPKS